MNDLTKEELGIIYCNLAINDKTKDVLGKITIMYESYCEHEWRCWDDKDNTRECMKCGEERKGEITS